MGNLWQYKNHHYKSKYYLVLLQERSEIIQFKSGHPVVKHYNDLLYEQSSERNIDKVTYFYVGDLFCIHLGTKNENEIT